MPNTPIIPGLIKKMLGSKFQSSTLNFSTSAVGSTYTAYNAFTSMTKATLSPSPCAKVLYCASAGLNILSCASCCVSLYSGHSIVGVPTIFGSLGFGASSGAEFCNCVADCVNPTGSGKVIQKCFEECKKWFLSRKISFFFRKK